MLIFQNEHSNLFQTCFKTFFGTQVQFEASFDVLGKKFLIFLENLYFIIELAFFLEDTERLNLELLLEIQEFIDLFIFGEFSY